MFQDADTEGFALYIFCASSSVQEWWLADSGLIWLKQIKMNTSVCTMKIRFSVAYNGA
jgi:hypothetical protein